MDEVKAEQWKKLIADQEASGMTVGIWCRTNNVSESRFYYWRNELYGPKRIPTSKSEFVEISPCKRKTDIPAVDPGSIEAVLHYGDYSLTILNNTSERTIDKIIRVTRNA